MQLTPQILTELQNRLKIGNRRGVHLNAIPGNSRYKLDLKRFSLLDKNLPEKFIEALLTKPQLSFKINQRRINTDLNTLKNEEQKDLVKLNRTFDNLIFQTEAIQSEKGINTFAFGFPILIRRDLKDDKLTVAPLFIWSLNVKNLKDKTWEITRNEDDPVYLNEVLINHLIADSNIEIDKVTNDDLEDGFLTKEKLVETCLEITKTINGQVPNDIGDVFKKKLSNVSAINAKKYYEDLPISASNSLIEFGGLFSIFEVQKQNIIGDYGNLMNLAGLEIRANDFANFEFQSISSVETDPSQQSILNSLKSSSHIVIQGPPGTGKSQTLSAILINAMENRKKSLVVCEKRTALEILEKSLTEKGLNSHCVLIKDIIHDRRRVVDSVRERLNQLRVLNRDLQGARISLRNLINKSQNLIQSINRKHAKIDKKLLGNKNWTDVVGMLIREKKHLSGEELLQLDKTLFLFDEDEFNALLEIVSTGQKLYPKFKEFEAKSWINPSKISGSNPYEIQENLQEDFKKYQIELNRSQELYNNCRSEYIKFRAGQIESLSNETNILIDQILDKEKEFHELLSQAQTEYAQARQEEIDQQFALISGNIKNLSDIYERHTEHSELTNSKKVNSFAFKILTKVSKKKLRIFEDHHLLVKRFEELEQNINFSKDFSIFDAQLSQNYGIERFQTISKSIENTYNNAAITISQEFSDFDFHEILNTRLSNLEFNRKHQEAISKNSTPFELKRGLIIGYFSGFITELKKLIEKLETRIRISYDFTEIIECEENFSHCLLEIPKIKERLFKLNQGINETAQSEFENYNWLGDKASAYSNRMPSLVAFRNSVNELKKKFNQDIWCLETIDFSNFSIVQTKISQIIFRKNEYFNNPDEPFNAEFDWFTFYNKLSSNQQQLINALKSKMDWKRHFIGLYLDTLLLRNAHTDLPKSDDEHLEFSEIKRELEKAQINFIAEYWNYQQIEESKRFRRINDELSVENLFNKRKSSKHSRLSLRQIVKYDLDLFTTFFPIILTTPDVASNLFQGINGYFDIIMFDEASQLRIEDNLPALFKGKQIVIAGDEHQMPPSNYFHKIFDGSIDDDSEIEDEDQIQLDKNNIVLSCESLLDFGNELNFKKQHLDFHYRSKHPYLIDFSNYAFYNQRLKPLPSTSSYVPIKFVNVNGVYSDHTNAKECETILSILENNINRKNDGEYPTVGIATFNVAQRDFINSKIQEVINSSKNEAFVAKLVELIQNGMFIKNLENIQGDERDLILISTTYGNTIDKTFAQRFGPINFDKGYKLLNVLITRAKHKIYLCTSIPEKFYLDYKSYLVTEKANNKKAVFYAYLAYCKAVSEENHEARLAVLQALSENTNNSTSNTLREIIYESPFEEEVFERLTQILAPDKLFTQYKVSEFRIDIVYDPENPSVPKIAIECDGANYHSSPEAYLYDCHRQKILESHGFVFHRIWSTNWWRNPERELANLTDFISQIEKQRIQSEMDSIESENVFSHEVILSDNPFKNLPENDLFGVFDDDISKITIGSIVTVKYLNDGKILTIELTDDAPRINPSQSVQKINLKSPLATSLLGHKVGEKVKIPGGDLIIEIMAVEN